MQVPGTNGFSRWAPAALRICVVAAGVVHAMAAIHSHSMNADGVSYLDIGDAYMRGDVNDAINPVWSPFYSWVLGFVLKFVRPSMQWEFAVVHLTNLVIFLVSLAAFEYFWHQLSRQAILERRTSKEAVLPEWIWRSMGYVLFSYAALCLIEIWAVTPDMLMAVWVFIVSGLLVRLRSGFQSTAGFAVFGLTLGLAYLTKSVMFPLSFVFMGTAWLCVQKGRRLVFAVVAVTSFVVVTAPHITLISKATGGATYGEAGRLTYLRHVNGIPYPHWQGHEPEFGKPDHPTRAIHSEPAVFEFADPIPGTYPISYNPSYWYEGATVRVDAKRQTATLAMNVTDYVALFFRDLAGLTLGVLLIYALARIRPVSWTEALRRWSLLLPSLAALGLYAIVLVEGRYIAVFLVIFFGELMANARDVDVDVRHSKIIWGLMTVFLAVQIGLFSVDGLFRLTGSDSSSTETPAGQSWPGETAEALQTAGLGPGDTVGVIGYGFDSYWARLGKVRIVAELPVREAKLFWDGDPALRASVLSAFRSAGVRAVVAEHVPPTVEMSGWQQVGSSSYHIFVF